MRHWLWTGLLFGTSAYALSMGPVSVDSNLNEPLEASIPLMLEQDEQLTDYDFIMSSTSASSDVLLTLTVSATDEPVLFVTSDKPIQDKKLKFSVSAQGNGTTTTQDYKIQLNDPTAAAPQPKPLVYGPVKGGDTLWRIAREFSEFYGISEEEAVQLLFEHNKRSFVKGNIDQLMAGAFLRLPKDMPIKKMPEVSQQPQIPATFEPMAKRVVNTTLEAKVDKKVDTLMPAKPADTKSAQLAFNASSLPGLELIMNDGGVNEALANTLGSLLANDDSAFVKLMASMQQDLSMAKEAIDTERRAKEALKVQLDDLQIQIKALTELVSLKDSEIVSLLDGRLSRLDPNNRSQSLILWDKLPDDLAAILAQAGNNQIIMLMLAVLIASFMLYLWDHLTGAKPKIGVPVTAQAREAVAVKAQPLKQTLAMSLQDVDVYMAYGRYSQAQDLLEHCLGQNPNDFDVLLKLCDVYVKSDSRHAFEDKMARISDRWKHKYPDKWRRISDKYERAWPVQCMEADDKASETSYEGDPPSDPTQTKLDLARAYIDIGDNQSAIDILTEVVSEGNEAQVMAAEMLLNNLKH